MSVYSLSERMIEFYTSGSLSTWDFWKVRREFLRVAQTQAILFLESMSENADPTKNSISESFYVGSAFCRQ